MPSVHSKYMSASGGLPSRVLRSAALLSFVVVIYSYAQHKKTTEQAKRSLAVASALSSGSMRSLRAGTQNAYGASQRYDNDECELKFEEDAAFFSTSLIDKTQTSNMPGSGSGDRTGKGSGKLSKSFFLQLRALARIMIPSLTSREMLIILMHSMFLILRTWLSVVVAELDGKIVKHLVRGEGHRFLAGLLSWFAIAVPATYTNSMIRFLESKLALAFRTRLTQYVHDLYLSEHLNYYKLLNLDSRISNPDQFITTDIARFCNKLASFLSNLGKPTLDTIIFNIQLIRGVGLQGALGMFGMYMATASLLRAWTPPFGKMAAASAKLEGEFRANHSRVITNAEEIAFYRGEKREEEQLQGSLSKLLAHAQYIARRKIPHIVLEDMVIKYTWSAFGYLVCALPFFSSSSIGGGGGGSRDGGYRTQRFITNKRILINLSDAGGRVMYSIKEIMELTGYTNRVYSLISTLHALRRDEYERPNIIDSHSGEVLVPEFSSSKIDGVLYEDIDRVRFTNVPIVAPSIDPNVGGELLVRSLTWEVHRGQHWMITGPNGVGKTSIMRVLSGLWPVFTGIVERPEPSEIFYIPQRAYLPLGTLRDQIIYPHTYEDMQAHGRTDEELIEVLQAVHLAYLPAREGGMGTKKEWKDVLSGGEKQRINLARLFYHLPRFAVLDECTSAVSADVEGLMYEHAKELGITLITISHRPSLYKYHTYLLRLGVNESDSIQAPGIISPQNTTNKENVPVANVSHDANSNSEIISDSSEDVATELWEVDVGESRSTDDSISSGVQWDIVQLSASDTSSNTISSSNSSSNGNSSPINQHPPIPFMSPSTSISKGPETLSVTLTSAAVARTGAINTINDEIKHLKSLLENKKNLVSGLKSRLDEINRELLTVIQ